MKKRIELNADRAPTPIADNGKIVIMPYGVRMKTRTFHIMHSAAGKADAESIPLDSPEFKVLLDQVRVKKDRQARLTRDYIMGMTGFKAIIK